MRVLFITPPYHCGVVEVAGKWPPLTLLYLASAVEAAGHEVSIFDAMGLFKTREDIRAEVVAWKPDVVCITSITATVNMSLEILAEIKAGHPRMITVLGGVHPTFCYPEILAEHPCVDYIVVGEGEEVLPGLLAALEAGQVPDFLPGLAWMTEAGPQFTGKAPFIQDLDALPLDHTLLDYSQYTYHMIPGSRLALVSSSRGCREECTFCSQQLFWEKTMRFRSPDSFLAEVRELHERHGITVMLITDEYPTAERERWLKILRGLIEMDLGVYFLMETRAEDIVRDEDILPLYRQAGIIHIYIGVEATRQETLERLKKNLEVETSAKALRLLREHHIVSETSFVLGLPDETEATIAETMELSLLYQPDMAHYLFLAPWPYAVLYEEVKEHIVEWDYAKYNLVEPIIKPEAMEFDAFSETIYTCYRQFYTRMLPSYARIQDPFHKKYILSALLMMFRSSFLEKFHQKLGRIPGRIVKLLQEMGADPEGIR